MWWAHFRCARVRKIRLWFLTLVIQTTALFIHEVTATNTSIQETWLHHYSTCNVKWCILTLIPTCFMTIQVSYCNMKVIKFLITQWSVYINKKRNDFKSPFHYTCAAILLPLNVNPNKFHIESFQPFPEQIYSKVNLNTITVVQYMNYWRKTMNNIPLQMNHKGTPQFVPNTSIYNYKQ